MKTKSIKVYMVRYRTSKFEGFCRFVRLGQQDRDMFYTELPEYATIFATKKDIKEVFRKNKWKFTKYYSIIKLEASNVRVKSQNG